MRRRSRRGLARRLRAVESRLEAIERAGTIDAAFYRAIEDRFRGSEAEIRGRQTSYAVGIRDIRNAWPEGRRGSFVAADLGSGRGELLDLLASAGVPAIGVEANPEQAAGAISRGRDVRIADLFDFLVAQPDGALGAVTALHVIEHMPFQRFLDLVAEIVRVLAPDGVVILETPNPAVLTVGANTFHIDPTHVKPLPHELVMLALERAGLADVEVGFLSHDPRRPAKTAAGLDDDVTTLLFGARDYAVRARKRG